ncbi:heavy-metal-associated domain-containing protein [Alsobacter sp. KACC 23698]|uniref:Heavy-metal-associated domain-containing protein n=1 Tax=Alsobacter sp. KACC 23698 TaxID=3149229 RepID=A0AAU7JE54_9HYPH
MCSCSQPDAPAEPAPKGADVTLKVDDMTCGHCAATVTKAVESAIPGTRVVADPATRLVSVFGAPDLRKVKDLIAAAGYTPVEARSSTSW